MRRRLTALALVTMIVVAAAPRSRGWMGVSGPSSCTKPSNVTIAEARNALRKAYRPSGKGYSLVEQMPACTAVGTPIAQATFESGNGHSFGIAITIHRIDRAGAGWDATRIELVRGKGSTAKWAGAASDGVRVLRGTLSSNGVEGPVTLANTLLEVALSEKSPVGTSAGWGTSGDFFATVALVGAGVVDRRFAGYHGSGEQMFYLPIEVASGVLYDAVPDKALSPSSWDAAARAIFVERFLAEAPSFDQQHHWWVRETYLAAAGDGGDASLLPKLHEYARRPSGQHSDERSRIKAIHSIVGITGDDRRFDKQGKERPVDDVGNDYGKKPATKKP